MIDDHPVVRDGLRGAFTGTYDKLNVRDRAAAVGEAFRRGIIT